MKLFSTVLIFLSFTVFSTSIFAQKKDPTFIGAANGIVRDSAFNYALQSATLAVYKVSDGSLVTYQLSNNYGEFYFKDLPLGMKLKMVVNFTGYKTLAKQFYIDTSSKKIDLKVLNLLRGEDTLKDIVVKSIPPVRMNGDTLEFNADAFKLDPNAQAEDLLRILPGVTVWGDGAITVNGRTVSTVLVNGKPFMGEDTKVTIQNLPKNAIDKIQVYQQKKDLNSNPYDSTTQVNIKLKKGKDIGHFGKIGAGIGTDKRYAVDGSLSFFNSSTQLALVAANNNTNKNALDVNTLLRNSSYKGKGASVEYQPDFRATGLNRPSAGGFIFSKHFTDKTDYLMKNQLTANYFINNTINKSLRDSKTTTALGGDSSLVQGNNSQSEYNSTNQHFNSRYDFSNRKQSFYIAPSFNFNSNQRHSKTQSNSTSSTQGLQSTNDAVNDGNMDGKNMTLQLGYNHRMDYMNYKDSRIPQDFSIDYTFNTGYVDNDMHNQSDFISFISPAQNKKYDRTYTNHLTDLNQTLHFSVNNIEKLIFNKHTPLGIQMQLDNYLYLNTHKEDNVVKDKDTVSNEYVVNQYLTNKSNYQTFNDLPSLTFRKGFSKNLVNRYNKYFNISFSPKMQFYNQRNVSLHSFQNIDKQFQEFVPSANISYNNYQYGDFSDNFNLQYDNSVDYPSVEQLTPLVDSSDAYSLQQGNANLRPYRRQSIGFSFSHYTQHSRNDFSYNLNISANKTNKSIIDSSYYDKSGKRIGYLVNTEDGIKSISAGGNFQKSFKFQKNQLQLRGNTSFSASKSPSYVNGVFNLSSSFSNNSSLNVYYTYKDILNLSTNQSANFYHSKSEANNYDFKNATLTTSFSASINWTKRLNFGSNVNYNHSTSSSSSAIDFTIWNADVTYRFFKAHNLEMKFSALDLLHQNVSIINYGNINSLTRGTQNVLQHYFMFTVSYFPRQFGKKGKK